MSFRNIVYIAALIIISINSQSSAIPVDRRIALDVAGLHLQAMKKDDTYAPSDVIELKDEKGTPLVYVVTLRPLGFIAVSADTEIRPIIAYSLRCDFPMDKDEHNTLLHMLRRDMILRKEAGSHLSSSKRRKIRDLWHIYRNKDRVSISNRPFQQWPEEGSTPTGGWVETTWYQRDPFNNFCPLDPNNGYRCVTGCVATAMAQIVHYHQFIGDAALGSEYAYVTGNGIHIDRDSDALDFPDFEELNQLLIALDEKYDTGVPLEDQDLATLNFACGISIDMDYSSGGSGAWTENVAYALRNTFHFPSANVIYTVCDSFFSHLKHNMKNALPVELTITPADTSIGHAIVCDGYNTDEEYHLNFGWGPSAPDEIVTAWYHLPEGMPANYGIIWEGIMYISDSTHYDYVDWRPDKPQVGDSLCIRYGSVGTLFYSDPLFIHLGTDDWTNPMDYPMNFNQGENSWEHTIVITDSLYALSSLDFCFTDGNDNWDNNSGRDWHIGLSEEEFRFVMDGQLDDCAECILSSPDLELWATLADSIFYIASPPARYNTDMFIFISTSLGYMQNAPWAKSGWVVNWSRFLANEGGNNYNAWYDETEQSISASETVASACGGVLEGFIHLNEIPGFTNTLYLALCEYQTDNHGGLVHQLPAGNGDGNVDFSEYDAFAVPTSVVSDLEPLFLPQRSLQVSNYPNPFNPETWINYKLPEPGPVTVRVYNIQGQLVSTLVNEEQTPGNHQVRWDGRDPNGIPVASGIYFCQMKAGNFRESIKMSLVR